MLIIAGVIIATLTGENGILTRAQEAKNKTEEAKEEVEKRLEEYEEKIDSYDTSLLKNQTNLAIGQYVTYKDTYSENNRVALYL